MTPVCRYGMLLGSEGAALTGISILGTGEVSKLGSQISSGTLCSLALEVRPSQNYEALAQKRIRKLWVHVTFSGGLWLSRRFCNSS